MKITKDMTKVLLQEIKVVVRKHRATKLQNLPRYVIIDHVTGLHLVLESKLEGRTPFLAFEVANIYIKITLDALETGRLTEYTLQFPDMVLHDLARMNKLGDIKVDCANIAEYLRDLKRTLVRMDNYANDIAMYKDLSKEELDGLLTYLESSETHIISKPYYMFIPSKSDSKDIIATLFGGLGNRTTLATNSQFSTYVLQLISQPDITESKLIEFCTSLGRKLVVDPAEVSREIFSVVEKVFQRHNSVYYDLSYMIARQKDFEKLVKIPKNKKISAKKFYTHQYTKQAVYTN